MTPHRPPASSDRRFALWNDGSVSVNCEGCTGELSGEDVDLLVAYVQRLRQGDRA
jgi:hypothetical protein